MKQVILFSAQWCGPCKAYKPSFSKISEEHKDKALFEIRDVDTDESALEYKIRGVPSVVIVEDGKEINRAAGVEQISSALKTLFE